MRGTVLMATVALAGLCAARPASADTLNLLIWEAYIDQSILTDWTAETGIEVRQTYYDSGDARDESALGWSGGRHGEPLGSSRAPCGRYSCRAPRRGVLSAQSG